MSEPAVDTLLQPLSPSLQQEFYVLRDERDLYRSLLMSDPDALATFLNHALQSADTMRATLRQPTRQPDAFREKMERLQMELLTMEQALAGLHLPTVHARLQHAASCIHEIVLRAEITGNDLLPAMVLLEELCSHLLIAADSATLHAPLGDEESLEDENDVSTRTRPQRLAIALRQLCDKLCEQYGKRIELMIVGLEDAPDAWASALFDLLGQLVRNTVEHGIEPPAQRASLSKPETGSMAIEFVDRGSDGYELNVQDDGAGLDAERIAEAAARRGLLSADTTRPLEPSRVINLVLQPGITTVQDPARRGMGMQIVREHVQRLKGKLNIAAKRGQYVRFHISLPVP